MGAWEEKKKTAAIDELERLVATTMWRRENSLAGCNFDSSLCGLGESLATGASSSQIPYYLKKCVQPGGNLAY